MVIKEYFPSEYVQRDLDHKKIVCRSVLYKNRYEEKKDVFLKEGIVLKKLKHKNIIKCFDYFKENNTAYIVLEFYDGVTLDTYLNNEKRGLNDYDLYNIYMPIIDAVNYVHSKKYIHRDIKPNNIMVKNNGIPILIDFGSVSYNKKRTERPISYTEGFSPIELYSKVSNQGKYTDVYSLAATLYYLIEKEAPLDVTKRLFNDKFLRGIKNKKYDIILEKIIIKNLNLDYKKRDNSILKMKKRLKKYLNKN